MHLIDLRLDPQRLVRFAHDHGHNRGGDEDLGYALHAWLKASLGDLAPSSYRLLDQGPRGLRLLGYTTDPVETLREHAAAFAEPLAMAVCAWDSAASKPMPTAWQPGRWLGFELRACPVSRSERGERDVFLAHIERNGTQESGPPTRDAVYQAWLQQQLGPATELNNVLLSGFRLVSTYRRRHDAGGRAQSSRRLLRPDALFEGTITVRDGAGFARLLARGVGRHRAFGFGMLLLRPAGAAT